MAVAVLLVTHGGIGREVLATAESILGGRPLPAATITVPSPCDTNAVVASIEHALADLDGGDGVLLLTDLFGATPCNLANVSSASAPWAIITGLNLPMLIKVFNYAGLDLAALADKALEGGREGILRVSDAEFRQC